MPRSCRSCASQSSMVRRPAKERSTISSAFFWSNCSCARSTSVSTSPMPRIRDAIRSGANGSRSETFSPVPQYMIGLPMVSRIDSAAPPRASPSSLVRITPSTWMASSNPLATFTASWPVIASTARIDSCTVVALRMSRSSSRSGSSICSRPAVSRITTSQLSRVASATPRAQSCATFSLPSGTVTGIWLSSPSFWSCCTAAGRVMSAATSIGRWPSRRIGEARAWPRWSSCRSPGGRRA